jgi:hypothetical protein
MLRDDITSSTTGIMKIMVAYPRTPCPYHLDCATEETVYENRRNDSSLHKRETVIQLGSNRQSIQVTIFHKLSYLFSKPLLTNEACSEDEGLEMHD